MDSLSELMHVQIEHVINNWLKLHVMTHGLVDVL